MAQAECDGEDTIGSNAYAVISTQAGVVVAVAAVMTLQNPDLGKAAFLGGLTVLVPNAWFAWASTRRRPGGWLLVQGVVKFVFAVVLMAVTLRTFSPEPLGFFGGVIAAVVAHAAGGFWQQRAR